VLNSFVFTPQVVGSSPARPAKNTVNSGVLLHLYVSFVSAVWLAFKNVVQDDSKHGLDAPAYAQDFLNPGNHALPILEQCVHRFRVLRVDVCFARNLECFVVHDLGQWFIAV
jgi:hypothetical protein